MRPYRDGEPSCPRCGCPAVYAYAARRAWERTARGHRFSVTSGTVLASRKLPIRTLLAAVAIFANAAKGLRASRLGRDLDVRYKMAFVLARKLREALGAGQDGGRSPAASRWTARTPAARCGGRVA